MGGLMKRTVVWIGVIFMLFLCACGNKKKEKGNESGEVTAAPKETEIASELIYSAKEPDAFCIDPDGNLYAFEPLESAFCIYDAEGKQLRKLTESSYES